MHGTGTILALAKSVNTVSLTRLLAEQVQTQQVFACLAIFNLQPPADEQHRHVQHVVYVALKAKVIVEDERDGRQFCRAEHTNVLRDQRRMRLRHALCK